MPRTSRHPRRMPLLTRLRARLAFSVLALRYALQQAQTTR